jgi:hypothetical protein
MFASVANLRISRSSGVSRLRSNVAIASPVIFHLEPVQHDVIRCRRARLPSRLDHDRRRVGLGADRISMLLCVDPMMFCDEIC